jgi:hypothetical protein
VRALPSTISDLTTMSPLRIGLMQSRPICPVCRCTHVQHDYQHPPPDFWLWVARTAPPTRQGLPAKNRMRPSLRSSRRS